jgi:hypothetical protein
MTKLVFQLRDVIIAVAGVNRQGAAEIIQKRRTAVIPVPGEKKGLRSGAKPLELIDNFGAGGRNRTDTTRGSGDFESPASTNFTTPARVRLYGTGARRVKDIWSGPVR